MTYLHSLFERNVTQNPNLIALKFEDYEISYGELDAKSNQLANYLVKNQIIPGDKVLIFLERSIEMIISILAILKAGATYVPVDPKTPANRFKLFIEDFDNPMLICNSALTFESNKIQNLVLDFASTAISEMPIISPNIKMDEHLGAVILYTSGSTGQPKGVLLSHKALVNRLLWDSVQYKHSFNDIILQHASYNFDFSILEIFMALANGGKLILARQEFHYESTYLLELIQNEKITKMGSVPSLLQAYINLPSFANCTSLKQVFLGGESLKFELQQHFFLKSKAQLINIYGPTETSISVLNWDCKRDSNDKIIPIGFPVAGMEIYIVDDSNQIIFDDRIGEIYISGVGIATEYYKRPDLNEKHFVYLNNKKMFRTFDLGRKLTNGAFQFCGRSDNQVKIRGLRVELEEIEYQLSFLKNIKQNIVHLVENENYQKRIVAYVILDNDKEFDLDYIRRELLNHLPDYMIPSYFIPIEKFDLTPNGKIDKSKLPLPDINHKSNLNYVPPSNEIQKIVTEIWCKVLQLNNISIIDTFENLGGDSISLLEIHHYIEEKLALKLPISELSKFSTISILSDAIERINEKKSEIPLIQVHRLGKEKTPILFVGPVYGIANSKSVNLLKYIDNNHAFLTTVDLTILNYSAESIEDFARIYLNELEKVYPSNEYIVGGYSMGGLVALEMISLLNQNGKTVKGLFLIDTYHPSVVKIWKKVNLILQVILIKFNYLFDIIANIFEKRVLIIQQNNVRKEILEKGFNNKDRLHESVLKYIPKNIEGFTVLISADKGEGILSKLWQICNVKIWNKLSCNKIVNFSISTNHVLLMENPYVEKVAEKINEEIINL